MTFGQQVRAGWARLRGGQLSPGRAAVSIFVGIFVGCSPFYGMHAPIVLAICIPLRLDAAIAYVAAHISNPLTGPFLFALELELGSLILTGHATKLSLEAAKHLGVLTSLGRLLVGWSLVGPAASLLGAMIAWTLTLRVRDAREPARAVARRKTRERYRGQARSIRWYVRLKLWTDPSLDVIAGLGKLGRVVDAGAGVGHVGLGLLDQRRATALVAIERDAERLAVGKAAAGEDATFEERDLRGMPFPPCDTALFADSLHYMNEEEQRAVLSAAATALAPGGRIVIRDVDSSPSHRSRFTKFAERGAARRRGVREPLYFHSAELFASMLRAIGLDAIVVPHEQWSITADVLVVGTKPAS